MSLKGKTEGNTLRGKVSIPDTLHGKSAYEIAVINGFSGTEAEWLKSLKGDKGDAGSIKFIPVAELPTENIDENAIYLLPSTNPEEKNIFLEYVYIDGKPEIIGSASVEVNLNEYVKNTDYASHTKAGVVKVTDYDSGLIMSTDGKLRICSANGKNIRDKTHEFKPITPDLLDLAVKVGMTTNEEEWTEEDKAAARELIGAVGSEDYATTDKAGVIKVGKSQYGLMIVDEILKISSVTKADIREKTNDFKPITSATLDYAVKTSITTNTETLTEEEKAAACEWLGAIGKPTNTSGFTRVPVVYANTNAISYLTAHNGTAAGSVALRGVGGVLKAGEPVAENDCTTKGYVDALVGDIETALDNIIAIQERTIALQESLIGGDGR